MIQNKIQEKTICKCGCGCDYNRTVYEKTNNLNCNNSRTQKIHEKAELIVAELGELKDGQPSLTLILSKRQQDIFLLELGDQPKGMFNIDIITKEN